MDDLEPERQYQFWVTAVTNAGEGMRSDIVVQTPSKRGKYILGLKPFLCNVCSFSGKIIDILF